MSSPVVSSRTPIGQIINRDGTATFAFLKWMQNIGTTINVTFDSEGSFQGDIGDQATIDGRATLASIVQHISTDGVVQGPGIDFALPYLNKDTDHIADGTGSPLAGGKEAYAVLVASGPAAGQTIRFNGTDWLPVAIAVSKIVATSQWLRSYDAATGTFTAAQPDFSDLSGSLDPSQLPADVAYTDQPNVFTANQTISANLSVSGTVNGVPAARFPFLDPTSSVQTQLNAKQPNLTLTTTGTSGPSTLVGATLNIPVYTAPAQVYPATGIGVSTGSAWGTSIDPTTIPRLGSPNTFTATNTMQALNVLDGVTTLGNTLSIASSAAGPTVASLGSSTNLMLDAGGDGSIFLNHHTGTGGTKFSNGAGGIVGTVDSSGNANFTGTLSAGGAKTFIITHPLDDTKDLYHACLEGPENGVYYRGEAQVVDGYATVTLPDYFEALTFPDDRSVQLTQIWEGAPLFARLAASRIVDGKFTIHATDDVTVAWEVKAVRRIGVERLQVSQDKHDD